MFRLCPAGRRINALRRKFDLRNLAENSTTTGYDLENQQRHLDRAAKEDGCFDYLSCVACPRGRSLYLEWLNVAHPYWDIRQVETALTYLSVEGHDRHLPDACDVGKRINDLMELEERGFSVREAITELEQQHHCTMTLTCSHCERGLGVLRDMLNDLSIQGMDSETGNALRQQHPYL